MNNNLYDDVINESQKYADLAKELQNYVVERNSLSIPDFKGILCVEFEDIEPCEDVANFMMKIHDCIDVPDYSALFATRFVEIITKFMIGDSGSIGPYQAQWLMGHIKDCESLSVPLITLLCHIRDEAVHIAEPLASYLGTVTFPELQK